MSYLLEILGRGLVSSLRAALRPKLPDVAHADVAALRRRVQVAPRDDDAAVLLGTWLLWEEEFLKAGACFRAVLDHDDECLPAILGLACVHDEMGRVGQALDLLNQARTIDIMDPVILFCVGFCCEKLEREDEAIHAYRASLRACEDLRNSHERLAAVFLKRGDHQLALEHYEQLVALEPDRMADRLALGNLYLEVGRPDPAIRQYETALALDPDNWELQDDLVGAYHKAGLLREAIEMLHQLIRHQPELADNHLRLGDLYAQAGDDVSASGEYRRALDLHPEYLEAMVKMGTAQLRLGEPLEAARLFNQAVEVNDRLLTACVGLGVAQLKAGLEAEGLSSFELASKIEPNSTMLFSESARMQLKAAIGDQLQKYLGADPAPEALSGKSELAQALIEKQIERHRQAICEKPDHADLHYRLGLLLKNHGSLSEAIAAFRNAVRINPVYEKALVKLGLALREDDHVDEAVTVLTSALALNPDAAQLHYQLGLIFAEKHLFELAVEHFEKASSSMPDQPDLQANLALALQNAGLLDRAEVAWRTTMGLETAVLPNVKLS